jgi:hypothetical protein
MVYNTQNHWAFGLRPLFEILINNRNTAFRKPGLFPSSSERKGITTLLGRLDRAKLNNWTKTETDPGNETLCFLVI